MLCGTEIEIDWVDGDLHLGRSGYMRVEKSGVFGGLRRSSSRLSRSIHR
jgi:hypothetical protein